MSPLRARLRKTPATVMFDELHKYPRWKQFLKGFFDTQEQTGAPLTFQVVVEADYVDADCFASPRGPLVVPAKTLLSQLL